MGTLDIFEFDRLQKEIAQLKKEHNELVKARDYWKQKVMDLDFLVKTDTILREEIKQLKEENYQLKQEINRFEKEKVIIMKINDTLLEVNNELSEVNDNLRVEIISLK